MATDGDTGILHSHSFFMLTSKSGEGDKQEPHNVGALPDTIGEASERKMLHELSMLSDIASEPNMKRAK